MRDPLRPTVVFLASAMLLAGGTPLAANAQTVRGRLVDAADDVGIGGAMMSLMDRSGGQVSRVLTRNSGLFELSTPMPGNYRLRADRIGYATTFSDYFDLAAGDTLSFRMVAAVEAVSLRGIEAEADRRCRVRPEEGLAVTRVWDEARKALAAAEWTQERGYYRYEMTGIKRQLGREGRKVISEDRTYQRAYVKSPFVSRPADELMEGGFAQLSPRESVYWAPDAGVLLSDAFLDTHCFRVQEGGTDAPGLIGLAFEPVPGRRIPEIAGTLWLDPATSQLRWLDYGYRNLNLPTVLSGRDIGGKVEFQALPNGTWIVNSWRIRMPRGGTAINPLTGSSVVTLEGISEQGGDVIRVHGNEGTVLEADLGGRIVGIVFDSLRAGLAGARVFIEGMPVEVPTNAGGRFELAHLQSGVYSVNFTHPYLEAFSYRPEPFQVEVGEGTETPAQVNFAAPPVRRILDNLCRDEERPEDVAIVSGGNIVRNDGILVGHVTDTTGAPLAGVTVRIVSREYGMTTTTLMREGSTGVAVTTNASGHYLACWVPVDTNLHVTVLANGQEPALSRRGARSTVSDILGTREETVVISPQRPYQRLDLRVETR